MSNSRRAFLGGLLAVIAAPAVVHAGVLMPVRSIERFTTYDTRFLVAYNVGTDEKLLRVDRAQFKLHRPKTGIVAELTEEQAIKYCPELAQHWQALKPGPLQQLNVSMAFNSTEAAARGVLI